MIAVDVVIGTVFVVSKISAGVIATIALINTLIKAYNALKASAIVAGIASAFALNPLLGVGAVALAAGVLSAANAFASKSDTDTIAGPSTGSIPFAAGFGPSKVVVPVVPSMTGAATGGGGGGGITTAANAAAVATNNIVSGSFNAGTFRAAEAATSGATYNINVSGAFDRERTAREIVDTINDSFYRGTGGANNLQIA